MALNLSDIIEIAKEFRNGIIGSNHRDARGMCFMISAPLEGLLNFYGVETSLVCSCHEQIDESPWVKYWWIRLPGGLVLDPTFDLLEEGVDPVYLGPPTKWHVDGD